MIKKADPSRMKSLYGANPCKLAKKKPGRTYVHNILAEMWDLITPEMANRMKEIFMVEFGLSEQAALDFICRSRYETSLTAHTVRRRNMEDENLGGKDDRPPEGSAIACLTAAQKLCKNELNIDINPFHIREFSKELSSKFSKYVATVICAKRNSKHRSMAEAILRGLCDLTGEETTLDSPKNRLHKILTLTSDRIALWLAGNVEDEDKKRANKRKREDNILKRKTLARQRERKNRQKQKDRINKEKEKNERKKAQEGAEKGRSAYEEKERKKLEREKRHQEMERFREEEKRKQKEEIKKAKEESIDTNTNGGQVGGDRSKLVGAKPGENYRPAIEQTRKGGLKSGSKGQNASETGASTRNQAKNMSSASNQPVKLTDSRSAVAASSASNQPMKATNSRSAVAASSASNQPVKLSNSSSAEPASSASNQTVKVTDSSSALPASESLAGISTAADKVGRKATQSGDIVTKSNSNQNQLLNEISKASQLSTSKSVNWGEERIKNVASAFSASGKMTPTSSKSSSVEKLVELLSSRGKLASGFASQEKSATAVTSYDRFPAALSSQGIHAKVVSSQGKLASEHSSHLKLGAVSISQDKLATTDSQRRKGSLVTVKKTASNSFEVHRSTYSEAKQKIGAVKRDSAGQTLPPNVPFDPHDPKSLAQWLDHATQMAEDWGRWIDKTIQDTEDKAILYQAKVKEGKTRPEDVEDWNRFVQKTNEDALRWRRQRKSMTDAAKEWKQH